MCGEQDERHAGGQGEVGGVGFASGAKEIAEVPEDEHSERGKGEGEAEEAHGRAGEVEEVAEGEIVIGGVLIEDREEVGGGGGVGGGYGEEEGDQGH